MPAPSSILQMCVFGNTITLAVLSLVLWIFILVRVQNGCKFWGGYSDDITDIVVDMVNANNWCTVKEGVPGRGIGLMVGMWLNFSFSAIALWLKNIKPAVGFNLVVSFPIQIFFAIFSFIVAAAAGSSKVIHANVAVILCGVMLGLMSLFTPITVYISLFMCRPDVLELPGDREAAEAAEARRSQQRVREMTSEIIQQRELEKKYLAQQRAMRGRGGRGGGRGGGGRAGGPPGRGGGGRGGPSNTNSQAELTPVHNTNTAAPPPQVTIVPNNNNNQTVAVAPSTDFTPSNNEQQYTAYSDNNNDQQHLLQQ